MFTGSDFVVTAYSAGTTQGAVAVPAGLVVGAGGGAAGAGAGVLRYPGYVYTTVYSPGPTQYVLPTPTPAPTTAKDPTTQKLGKM